MDMSSFPILSVIGIEIEYMLVDADSLSIAPLSDKLLMQLAGELVNEWEIDEIAVSNELVLHVIELKNNGPKEPTFAIAQQFQQGINQLQSILAHHNMKLMPSAAHPWMNPLTETRRWPHGNQEIYRQYDKIFDCRGHGWANLQSMHVNLPFSDENEFIRLHNAVRLILPLLPALAASSPILDRQYTGWQDSRLHYYEINQQKIPQISGHIIPEFIRGYDDYNTTILQPMYDAIKPHDVEGILQNSWLNSRGAIAKFDLNAIEIRILDSQECVNADISIALLIHALLKNITTTQNHYLDNPCETERLKSVYQQSFRNGLDVWVDDSILSQQWELPKKKMKIKHILSDMIERVSSDLPFLVQQILEQTLSEGNLSQRIRKACGSDLSSPLLHSVYQQLAYCLTSNQRFTP